MLDHPYDKQWPEIRELAEQGGVVAVIESIRADENLDDRRGLFSLACGKLSHEEWPGKSLDATIEIARAAIAEGLEQAANESDPAEAAKCLNFSNVLSYNLAADLADCWPEDDRTRERHHFETGLAAADDCIRWRKELGKGPFPFSIAYWAHGMHSLSLGDTSQAVTSFERSLEAAREFARGEGKTDEAGASATFGVNLGVGYLGLARWRHGLAEGEAEYKSALTAFIAQKRAHPDQEIDANFGIAQLHTAAARTAP